jgi:hypothetical protein
LSSRARIHSVLPLLVLALASRVAHAAPQLFVDLDYRPDAELAGCPTDAAFRAMIREELGYDPFRAGEQKVVARAHASEPGLQGFVEWYDVSGTPRGKRELRAETTDCTSLARSMSFAIAVQIQLLAQEPETPVEASTERPKDEPTDATLASPAATTPGRPSDSRPAPARRSNETAPPWQFMLGAGPVVAFGLAPRTAFEARVFGGARRGRFAGELGVEGSLPARYETETGDGFEQRVVAGSAAGCAFFGRLSGCVVSKLGSLHVRGFGVDVPNSDAGVLAQIGPRVTLSEVFGDHWFGALRVEALATLHAWEVTLNQSEVWKTPLFSLSVGADVGAILQ